MNEKKELEFRKTVLKILDKKGRTSGRKQPWDMFSVTSSPIQHILCGSVKMDNTCSQMHVN